MKSKDLEYYMNLPYPIEIVKIPENEGGGYSASIPLLGRYAVCADGDTVEEALSALEEIKRERFRDYLERGLSIPEPDREMGLDGDYSGRILLRMPKDLHRSLAGIARENGVSINTMLVEIIAAGVAIRSMERSIQRVVAQFVTDMANRIGDAGKESLLATSNG